MAHWSDLAEWRGPTENQGGPMKEHRGLVVHIAEGYYEGTIAYQKNPDANVSSHFIVGRDGSIAQMVDTETTAWTQSAGNGHWLSVENEGFTTHSTHYKPGWEELTAQALEANAQLLARGHREYGYPLQIATDPNGFGLGHHSMGCNWPAGAWGHCDCPGDVIIGQKQAILNRAREIVYGGTDMPLYLQVEGEDTIYTSDGVNLRPLDSEQQDGDDPLSPFHALQKAEAAGAKKIMVANDAELRALGGKPVGKDQGGTGGGGLDETTTRRIVREELDKTHLPAVPGTLQG